jgi:hypothetical protein
MHGARLPMDLLVTVRTPAVKQDIDELRKSVIGHKQDHKIRNAAEKREIDAEELAEHRDPAVADHARKKPINRPDHTVTKVRYRVMGSAASTPGSVFSDNWILNVILLSLLNLRRLRQCAFRVPPPFQKLEESDDHEAERPVDHGDSDVTPRLRVL